MSGFASRVCLCGWTLRLHRSRWRSAAHTYFPVIDRNHYLNLLITNYIWTPGAVLFRTAVVRHLGGFKTTVSGAEDYDLYLRIARNHRIWCHGNVVAEYRQHGANFSRNPGLMLRSTLDVIHAQRGCVGGNKLAERALRRAISKRTAHTANRSSTRSVSRCVPTNGGGRSLQSLRSCSIIRLGTCARSPEASPSGARLQA